MHQTTPATGHEGFLPDPSERREAVALAIAGEENITASEKHGKIVHFMRGGFEQYQAVPENHSLLKTPGECHGKETAMHCYSYDLFPAASNSRPARSPACASCSSCCPICSRP